MWIPQNVTRAANGSVVFDQQTGRCNGFRKPARHLPEQAPGAVLRWTSETPTHPAARWTAPYVGD